MEAAGLEANDDSLTKLAADLEGKDINELLAAGAEKIMRAQIEKLSRVTHGPQRCR